MSSLALPREAALTRGRLRALPAVFSQRGSDVLLGVAILALGAVLLASLPSAFDVDSWLALVTGREIWHAGLPQHESLTVIAHGVRWVDQQWLSQLVSYAVYLLGGLGLLGVFNVALLTAGVGGAVLAARRLGAVPRGVAVVLPLALFLIVPSREVRTQELAMPLFVALAWLLASDSRTPSRRVYWCLPILVLWANLHGTVTQGALLVVLRGVTLAWERRSTLTSSAAAWARPVTLVLGALLSLLATPYGLGIVAYYKATLFGGTLTHAVTEWQPITSASLTAVAFFLLAGVALWSFGRSPANTTSWERLSLLVLAAGSVAVIRNVLFFALFAVIVLPLSLGLASGREQVRDRLRGPVNALLSATAVAAVALATVVTLARPSATLEFNYQRAGVLSAVERATRAIPSLRVLTDDRFADWLLWRDPGLSGRLAYDVRYELLPGGQLQRLQAVLSVLGADWSAGARGYRLLVLDRKHDALAVRAFLGERGSRTLYDDGERMVILRAAAQAA